MTTSLMSYEVTGDLLALCLLIYETHYCSGVRCILFIVNFVFNLHIALLIKINVQTTGSCLLLKKIFSALKCNFVQFLG